MDSQHFETLLNTTTEPFNFDEWMELAKSDPDAFEKRRQEAINQVIDNSSEQSRRRLEGIQWQVDSIREQSKTPLAACLQLSRMMWEKVQGENGLVEKLDQLTGKAPLSPPIVNQNKADILPFRRADDDSAQSAEA